MNAQDTTSELVYGDWQDGGENGNGQYWYCQTAHTAECDDNGNEDCACDIQTISVFEDVQDTFNGNHDAPHQFYAWLGDWDAHDRTGNGMTGLFASRDEAVAALPE